MKIRQNGFLAFCKCALLISSMVATFSGSMIEVTHASPSAPGTTCAVGTPCSPGGVGGFAIGGRALTSKFSGPMAKKTQASPSASLTSCPTGTPCSPGGIGGGIGGGTLSFNSFAPIVNNGTGITGGAQDQTIPFRFLTTVSDARGSGAGWHISVGATAVTFTGGTADLILDPTIPVTVTCSSGSTCSSPASIPAALAAGADVVTAPVTVASAATNTGFGGYNVWTYGSFTLPGGAGGTLGGGTLSVTTFAAP